MLKKRFDKGRVFFLIPLNQSCPHKIKVTDDNGSFCVKISEVPSLVDSLAPSNSSWLEKKLSLNLVGARTVLRVDALPLSFTDHVVKEKEGPEVGGLLKNKDKGDGDQFSFDFGKNNEMVDRLVVIHKLFKPREEKLAVMALDIGIADRAKKGWV